MKDFRYTDIANMLKKNKIKVICPSVFLSATLVLGGCSAAESQDAVNTNSDEATMEEVVTNDETSKLGEINEKIADADTVVEKSITGTIELAKTVAEATDEFKQTEEYQQTKEQLINEFDTLVNWLLGNTEIDGYTINDIGSDTVDLAKDAVSYIDDVIESYIPEYKDKAKEKLSALGEFIWDKSTDVGAWLLNKGEEFADDVNEKRKEL